MLTLLSSDWFVPNKPILSNLHKKLQWFVTFLDFDYTAYRFVKLKGPWHEIFDLWFFSSNNSP
jgi:hypothetical protein